MPGERIPFDKSLECNNRIITFLWMQIKPK